MFAISNEELSRCPPLGKTIKCHVCGKKHKVKSIKTSLIKGVAYYKCRGAFYLAGIDGKEIK